MTGNKNNCEYCNAQPYRGKDIRVLKGYIPAVESHFDDEKRTFLKLGLIPEPKVDHDRMAAAGLLVASDKESYLVGQLVENAMDDARAGMCYDWDTNDAHELERFTGQPGQCMCWATAGAASCKKEVKIWWIIRQNADGHCINWGYERRMEGICAKEALGKLAEAGQRVSRGERLFLLGVPKLNGHGPDTCEIEGSFGTLEPIEVKITKAVKGNN